VRCPNGHESPDHQTYCGRCGAALGSGPRPADGRPTSMISQPPAGAATNPFYPAPAGRRSSAPGVPPSGTPSPASSAPGVSRVPRWACIATVCITAGVLVSGGIVVGTHLAPGKTQNAADLSQGSVSATPMLTAPASTTPPQITETQGAPPPAPAPAACGPDEAAALQSALALLPPEPVTGARWDSSPPASSDSNYDPCADLSTILVGIEAGTGSSPWQALMFHRGIYLGTGTLRAYGFTSLNAAASTKDTVVLSYRSGQSCTACGDGVVTTVRYHWDGARVQMLDPPPPG
jgi:hypothetical protein